MSRAVLPQTFSQPPAGCRPLPVTRRKHVPIRGKSNVSPKDIEVDTKACAHGMTSRITRDAHAHAADSRGYTPRCRRSSLRVGWPPWRTLSGTAALVRWKAEGCACECLRGHCSVGQLTNICHHNAAPSNECTQAHEHVESGGSAHLLARRWWSFRHTVTPGRRGERNGSCQSRFNTRSNGCALEEVQVWTAWCVCG